jgi:tRNA threonylcarbamoyladenosine biosynthesis protein TsaB
MILCIRTDSSQAVLALVDFTGQTHDVLQWEAGRRLSSELLTSIKALLARNSQDWTDIRGIIVYQGPGSFTGLRIGITVANTLAYSLERPLAGSGGDDWIQTGLSALKKKRAGDIVLPIYGAEANITRPKR